MRIVRALLLTALLAVPLGCDDDETQPAVSGQLVVYVFFFENGIEGRRIEIVQTGDTATTNASGLAHFALAPGDYTIRAYGINRGGPCCEFVDEEAEVKPGEEVRVEIWDCVVCR